MRFSHYTCASTAEIVANISPALMASTNDFGNDNRESRWVQNNSVYSGNISSPHQMPTLRHRASTGQLNNMMCPATPISTPQATHSQWNQTPNISPYWPSTPVSAQYPNYNQVMPPPGSSAPHAAPSTPTPSATRSSAPKPYVKRLKIHQKLAIVFRAIDKDAHWTFSEFLYYAFRVKSSDAQKLCRSKQHATIVSRFLQGRDKYTISQILASWMQTPDGRPQSPTDFKNMYSPLWYN